LPDTKVTDTLKNICCRVGVSGTVQESKKITDYYKRHVSTAIGFQTRSFKVLEQPKSVGFIRNRFQLNGTIKQTIAVPPAKWL